MFTQNSTPWNKNKKWDDQTKKTISESVKHTYKTGRKVWNKGKQWSPEVIAKIAKSKKGQTPWNKGTKGIMKAWNKGKTWSQEVKDKISESKKIQNVV